MLAAVVLNRAAVVIYNPFPCVVCDVAADVIPDIPDIIGDCSLIPIDLTVVCVFYDRSIVLFHFASVKRGSGSGAVPLYRTLVDFYGTCVGFGD